MSGEITCPRCGQSRAPVGAVPYPGELGEEIRKRICGPCWAEWEQAEVIVINELRLDFMDPRAHDTLVVHLREFLCLDAGEPPESRE